MDCPFCRIVEVGEAPLANAHALAFPDAFPLVDGHLLVVPKRHVADPFDLEPEEWRGLWLLVREAKERVQEDHHPDGFNVGFNLGPASGQTVPHAHVHVIPRHLGDVPDPRGGIRWVLPDRAAYWETE